MPKVTVTAPEAEVPEIDKSAIIKSLQVAGNNFANADKAKEGAMREFCVSILEQVEDNQLDKATTNDILCEVIAKAYGVKPSKVKNSPKDGGDPNLYGNVRSVLLNVVFCKEEHKAKRDKAIKEKQAWEAIKSYARTGLKNKPRRSSDGDSGDGSGEEYTAEKAGNDMTKLILRMRMAKIEFETIQEMFETAFEECEKAEAEADAEQEGEEKK